MNSLSNFRQTNQALIFGILCLFLIGFSEAVEPYTPVQDSCFLEPWRWKHIKELEGELLLSADEGEDGTIWFVTPQKLINYDGNRISEYPFPQQWSLEKPYEIKCVPDKGVYIFDVNGVFRWTENNWSQISDQPILNDLRFSKSQIINNHQLLSPRNDEILLIDGDSARTITKSIPNPHRLIIDPTGDLWISTYEEGKIYRYKSFNPRLTIHPENFELIHEWPYPIRFIQMMLREPTNEMLFLDSRALVRGKAFNYKTQQWREVEEWNKYTHNEHFAATVCSDGTVLIYCEESLLADKNGHSSFIHKPTFNHPVTFPFFVHMKDGRTLMGGPHDSTYIIDSSDEQWESYDGLNFEFEDKQQNQWFTTREGNVVVRFPQSNEWLKYGPEDGLIDVILTGINSPEGIPIFFGSHENHSSICYFSEGKWKRLQIPELGIRIGHLNITIRGKTIHMGSANIRGEMNPEIGGIAAIEWNGNSFEVINHIQPEGMETHLVGLVANEDGSFWTGGYEARFINPPHFSYVDHKELEPAWIDHMIKDSHNNLWVAQLGLGTSLFANGQWKKLDSDDGDFFTRVTYLHEDNQNPGQIWAGTQNGIYLYDGEHWFSDPIHPLITIDREGGSLKQSNDGSIWVNTSTRRWYFRWQRLQQSPSHQYKFKTIRTKTNNEAPETTITSFESEIPEGGLVFAEWKGKVPWRNKTADELYYSYRLNEGNWSPFSKAQQALLPNVPNGMNKLEVKARSLLSQEDSTPAIAHIKVIPVLWKQPWFLLSVSLTLSLLLYLLAYIIRIRERHIVEMEEHKLQFFTQISHELRTPLTVIIGPIEKLTRSITNPDQAKLLNSALKNAHKMLHLVDELLDFRRVQYGQHETRMITQDIASFIRDELSSLQPLVEQKKQTIRLQSTALSPQMKFDAYVLEKTINNVVSNAIKFTQEGGLIGLSVKEIKSGSAAMLQIEVEDNGPGIDKKEWKRIFRPFERVNRSKPENPKGSGIGLALVHSLLENAGGSITIESPIYGKLGGTRFTITLPIETVEIEDPERHIPSTLEEHSEEEDARSKILIVDDNSDILDFLESILKDEYTIDRAANGVIALEVAKRTVPDVILTDVMMPEMDGKALCEAIKKDKSTSHIPVVMLTALKSEEHEIRGLEKGADAYLTKPINVNSLKLLLSNLNKSRKRLHDYWKQHANVVALSETTINMDSENQEFIQKLIDTIEANMVDETFDVEMLAKAMFMSRMTLYRKLKSLLGESPGDLIRRIRLVKAAQILETTPDVSISRVVETIGFQDMSHFSRSFKKQFGCTPTQYQKKER